ncbi:MAG: hypothetical protein JWM36_4891 [Hyphomicrobiales bacterium]|nr:hypothetical protein [Hyphomicrobiales bacterium]
MSVLYPSDWRPVAGARGVAGGRNPRSDAVLLLLTVTNGVSESGKKFPVGVYPSRGGRGTVAQWDAFTSGCDARALLVLALGGKPDPALGLSAEKLPHRQWLPALPDELTESKPEQLELFEVAAA